ncbi:hypothetical protein [Polynucleobacter sp. AP-Melu-500A-A1]|uniref:hypothetical protein n=1 Tax=Polynucleobacter sp. AP-Melu-500A-A1 TaxID=2576929 RepID=UPI001C0BAB9B|nr:hypothetical protein [Polynucleobacter sp. AP-Melu-500A-A1]MBU3631485.1 hypothetical protein [Polynucleobacter sp. AP-Melu-500A-A1]
MNLFRILVLLSVILSGVVNSKTSEELSSSEYSRVELEAYAILQTLNANLLGSKSATRTLQAWCEDHQMADNPKIIAIRDTGLSKEVSPEIRKMLQATASDSIAYRRVKLYCGKHVLSEADNWYLPARLTPEMNALLTDTDTPFGVAVRDLNFHRQTEKVDLLWQPLPKNWEQQGRMLTYQQSNITIPDSVLQHQAILFTDQNVPFSYVIETYTKEIFAFPVTDFRK